MYAKCRVSGKGVLNFPTRLHSKPFSKHYMCIDNMYVEYDDVCPKHNNKI